MLKMEDSELEEGEACSYGGSIDPDNDLSYIDDKVQNILGHFQKDFEGDFSAENLGAKFGGYGSFLPTYQRSPVWCQPKTPAKPLASGSPIVLPGESQSGNTASCVSKKTKSGLASTRVSKKTMKSKKPSSRQDSVTKKQPGVFSKQNSLKLRIKMGSESIPPEKKVAAIYSGLGLDLSPDSLSGSEGRNEESQGYSLLLSPTSILNEMTTLPVNPSQLLSPLSDDLIHFIERENHDEGYNKYASPTRLFIESSSAFGNGLEPRKTEEKEKPSVEKKRKLAERNSKKGTDSTIKKSTETSAENSKPFDASNEYYNGAVNVETVGDVQRRSWGPNRHKDAKTSSGRSVREDKKTSFGDDDDDALGYSRDVGKYKGSKASDSIKKVKSVKPEHSSRKRKSDQIEKEPPQSSSKEQKSSVFQAEKKEVVVPLKPQHDGKKAEDTYKQFFGDLDDFEEDDNGLLEVKDSPVTEKRLSDLEDTLEKSSFPLAESQNVGSQIIPSLSTEKPTLIQENWVACDKCGKWRLLPFGVSEADLPDQWICTMLHWLPGMDRCNVPQEETTKAWYAMYQIPYPAPESQSPVQGHLGDSKPEVNQGDDNTKKKKKGFKKTDNGADKEVLHTKTIQPSARNGIINSSHGFDDLADEERQKHRQKEKGKAMDRHTNEPRSLKMNNKRNADLESMKIESFLFPDQSEQGNGRPTSSSGVPATSADRNPKPKPRVSSKIQKEEGGASDTGTSNSARGSKKRKLKENETHERKKARVLSDEKELRSVSKREYGHGHQNLIAATSSSSKISDSHKPRNSSHEAKCSPVESVSSSPMRTSNLEKIGSVRKKKEEPYSEGGRDRSQTRTKDKHESYMHAEPSLDANYENGGGHKDLPRKPDSDHHHRRSNESLMKKSGKGSSTRSKDKSQSIRPNSRDGPKDGSDKVARPNIPKAYDVERITETSNRAELASPSAHKKVDKLAGSSSNIQADVVTKATTTTQIKRKSEPTPSPLRKEVTSWQAAHNMLKEATDLKHTADRLKNSVSNLEHIELYFQACLKFLHGTFLLEISSNESARQGEAMAQSMKNYSSTAHLCGFCAHEYEKSREMGAAALAYKCMEAAYMRIVNSSYTKANRYRNELQTSFQMAPPGESPSSSASDIDNVNHLATTDKVGTSRGVGSPLVVGNHVVTAQSRSNILRLLQFAQDVNLAMDASRKSRVAFTAYTENLEESQEQGEGIQSIKTALDYSFQDMEGFLRLVKLAMKANDR